MISEIYTCLINLIVMFCIIRGFVDADCDSLLLPLIVETCHTCGHSLRLLWPPCVAADVIFYIWCPRYTRLINLLVMFCIIRSGVVRRGLVGLNPPRLDRRKKFIMFNFAMTSGVDSVVRQQSRYVPLPFGVGLCDGTSNDSKLTTG